MKNSKISIRVFYSFFVIVYCKYRSINISIPLEVGFFCLTLFFKFYLYTRSEPGLIPHIQKIYSAALVKDCEQWVHSILQITGQLSSNH